MNYLKDRGGFLRASFSLQQHRQALANKLHLLRRVLQQGACKVTRARNMLRQLQTCGGRNSNQGINRFLDFINHVELSLVPGTPRIPRNSCSVETRQGFISGVIGSSASCPGTVGDSLGGLPSGAGQ